MATEATAQPVEFRPAMLPQDLIRMARVVSGHTGEAIQEIYNRLLRGPLTAEYRRVGEEICDLGESGA